MYSYTQTTEKYPRHFLVGQEHVPILIISGKIMSKTMPVS